MPRSNGKRRRRGAGGLSEVARLRARVAELEDAVRSLQRHSYEMDGDICLGRLFALVPEVGS